MFSELVFLLRPTLSRVYCTLLEDKVSFAQFRGFFFIKDKGYGLSEI